MRKHFNYGVSSYRVGRDTDAESHFSNAVSIRPDQAVYWYYRAVAAKRLGREQDALYDVLYGAYVESKYTRVRSLSVTRGLQHVQGSSRLWIESFRAGDPSARILESSLEGL